MSSKFGLLVPFDKRQAPPANLDPSLFRTKADYMRYHPYRYNSTSVAEEVSKFLGSVLYRGQMGTTRWDRQSGTKWYNYTLFPAVVTERPKRGSTMPVQRYAVPYMVVYTNVLPSDQVPFGHKPYFEPCTIETTGETVFVDTAMLVGPDAQKSILSAINLAQPVAGSYIWFTRAFSNAFEPKGEGAITGPSMGLAVAACIMGAPPVAYTGFTRNIIMRLASNNGDMNDLKWNEKNSELEAVTKLSNIVEDVTELGWKISWAIENMVPLVIPHKSHMEVKIEDILNNDRFISSHGLPRLSHALYSAAQLNAGIPMDKEGTIVFTASTVTDAIVLGSLAYYSNIPVSDFTKKVTDRSDVTALWEKQKTIQAERRKAIPEMAALDMNKAQLKDQFEVDKREVAKLPKKERKPERVRRSAARAERRDSALSAYKSAREREVPVRRAEKTQARRAKEDARYTPEGVRERQARKVAKQAKTKALKARTIGKVFTLHADTRGDSQATREMTMKEMRAHKHEQQPYDTWLANLGRQIAAATRDATSVNTDHTTAAPTTTTEPMETDEQNKKRGRTTTE